MKKVKTSVQDVRKDASSIASPDRVQNIPCIMIDEAPDNEGIPMTNLEDLAQSIRQYGQLTPVSVYLKEDGRYELYSGHRRLRAVRDILKQDNIRCIVEPYENDPEKRFGKHLDANLQTRDKDVRFWIAEIGNALALVRQRETNRPSRTEDMDLVSELFKEHGLTKGFSRPSLYRIYQLKEMAPALLDTCQYGVRAATLYQAIGLTKEEQEILFMTIDCEMATPSLSQAQRMKQISREGKLTDDMILQIMSEKKKPECWNLVFPMNKVSKYFPKSYTPKRMEETIYGLLEGWRNDQSRREKA